MRVTTTAIGKRQLWAEKAKGLISLKIEGGFGVGME
jgi:hypothetical protein